MKKKKMTNEELLEAIKLELSKRQITIVQSPQIITIPQPCPLPHYPPYQPYQPWYPNWQYPSYWGTGVVLCGTTNTLTGGTSGLRQV